MGSDNYKWYVHCPVCGSFLEKSARSESEVDCRKCKSTVEILVKEDIVSVRPLAVRDEQLKTRMRVYAQKVRSGTAKTE